METNTPKSRPSIRTQLHDKVSWVDAAHPSDEILSELENRYHLHPVHLKESVQQVQHSQVERENDYLFFVLHIPVGQPGTRKLKITQVGIFLGKTFLVTIRSGTEPVTTKLFEQCEHDAAGAELFRRGPAYILYVLLGNMLQTIFTMTDLVVSELDAIEDDVFDSGGSDAQRIGAVRQKIVRLGRVIGPKKLILDDLTQQIDSFTGQSMARYFSNTTKTVNKMWEVIEEAKETVEIYKDADFTTSTERTNRILAVLTIIFTLSIPTTIVGTIYGMNVPLPGGLSGVPWHFLGRYTTVIITVAGSLLIAITMYAYFRRKKWF